MEPDDYGLGELDPLMLAVTQISTFARDMQLTVATGFFFRRGERLFLVTSRHVVHDAPTAHFPDHLVFTVHNAGVDLTAVTRCEVALYANGKSRWIQGVDGGGSIDVAVLEIPATLLPAGARLNPFSRDDFPRVDRAIPVGSPVLVPSFPLGFYDTVHHLPVVRRGSIASAFGVRFQGQGYFLTDARMHSGSSGAPVVSRLVSSEGATRATLLGVHSARMDMSTRDARQDDLLGLNCTWYADILLTLTEQAAQTGAQEHLS